MDTEVSQNAYKQTELGEIPKEWNLVQLSDVANRITTKNKDNVTNNVLTISAQYGLVSQTDFFKKQVASKNLEGYYLLNKKDFAYNKSYSKGYPMGAIKPLEMYEEGVVSSLYICFRFNEELIEYGFIKQYFETNLWHKEVSNIAQEGARNHGLLNVSVKEFFGIKLIIPSLKEQKKIAEILSAFDEEIKKSEQLVEKTLKFKKGLMQHLFRKGINYNDFQETDIGTLPMSWGVTKIEEISTVKTGGTPNRSIKEYWENGTIPWMSSGEVNLKRVNNLKEKITEEGYNNSNASLFPAGTVMIALNGQGKTRGTVALLDIEATCNQSLAGLIMTNKYNNLFLFYYLEFSYDKLRNITGEGRSGLNLSLLRNFLVPVPPIIEQEKIASTLSAIDEQIEVYKKEKEKQAELKQAVMQQLLTGKIRVTV